MSKPDITRAVDEHKLVLDGLALKKARPGLGGAGEISPEAAEHKAAFSAYMRRGDESALRALEEKAMSVGSAADGGYLVPPETDTDIGRRLSTVSLNGRRGTSA